MSLAHHLRDLASAAGVDVSLITTWGVAQGWGREACALLGALGGEKCVLQVASASSSYFAWHFNKQTGLSRPHFDAPSSPAVNPQMLPCLLPTKELSSDAPSAEWRLVVTTTTPAPAPHQHPCRWGGPQHPMSDCPKTDGHCRRYGSTIGRRGKPLLSNKARRGTGWVRVCKQMVAMLVSQASKVVEVYMGMGRASA